jgi:hypothetical protein
LHQRNQEIEIFGATDLTLCRSKIVWFQATDVWAIRQGKARQGKARQGKARQGKATQRKATQRNDHANPRKTVRTSSDE